MSNTDKIEAAVFRRLLEHLDSRKDVQNIELMNLAGFCRNCLSKWYMAAAEAEGVVQAERLGPEHRGEHAGDEGVARAIGVRDRLLGQRPRVLLYWVL